MSIRNSIERRKPWRFCAVGNIVKQHLDDEGIVRYGSKQYRGGTRIYIDGCTWMPGDRTVTVLGLNRFNHFESNRISTDLIENVRLSRIFQPTILRILKYYEFMDGWHWWAEKPSDRKEIKEFIRKWNRTKKRFGNN